MLSTRKVLVTSQTTTCGKTGYLEVIMQVTQGCGWILAAGKDGEELLKWQNDSEFNGHGNQGVKMLKKTGFRSPIYWFFF